MLPNRVNILGINVSAIDMAQAIAMVNGWIATREKSYVCVTPAHAVMDAYRDPQLRRVFNASGMTTPDGMAIVWLLKLRGYRSVTRVYGPDLMLGVCRDGVARGYRHFLYGGGEGVANALGTELRARLDGLRIVGRYTPPFRDLTDAEDRMVLETINATSPDVVWVGLSSPKQERWMAAHLGKVQAPVMIGVGAAFDFLSGRMRQAPLWMQRGGLEWLFRLMSEPKRLWPRYRQYPAFVFLAMLQLLGLRRFDG